MMNMNKLSRAGDNIHLSEEAKQRIIDGCNANMPDESGYTDHVMTVERYKPRRAAKFASIAAAFVILAGGTGATVYTLKNMGANGDTRSPGSGIERYTGVPIHEPHPIEYTHLNEYFKHNLNGAGKRLSDSQRQRIYDLLKDLTYTELDNYEVETPRTRGLFYTINENNFYYDGEYSIFIENDYLMTNWDAFLQPGTNGWQYYKLSENIEERFNAIYDEEFGPVLDNDFYFLEKGDIDEECQSEIREYLKNLKYEDSFTMISDTPDETTEETFEPENTISLYFDNEEYSCKLHISGNNVIFKVDYTEQADGNNYTRYLKQTCKAATNDNIASKLKLMIFKSHLFTAFDNNFEITSINIPGEYKTDAPLQLNEDQRGRVRELLKKASYKFATGKESSDSNGTPNATMTSSDEKYDYNIILSGHCIIYKRTNKLEREGGTEFTIFKSDYGDIGQLLTAATYGNDFVNKPDTF